LARRFAVAMILRLGLPGLYLASLGCCAFQSEATQVMEALEQEAAASPMSALKVQGLERRRFTEYSLLGLLLFLLYEAPAATKAVAEFSANSCEAQRDCGSCMASHDMMLSCRWCPETQSCHAVGSPFTRCAVTINAVGQCYAETCPYRLSDLLSERPADAILWAYWTTTTMFWPTVAFRTYQDGATGLFDLSSGASLALASQGGAARGIRIALAGDWGSGTCEARSLGRLMAAGQPHHTIHLGDVYYAGTPSQFQSNMLGLPRDGRGIGVAWPKGSVSTFFMNGNHEMISGGRGLFEQGFAYTGQETTYAAYLSQHWRMLLLDTGYESYKKNSDGSRMAIGKGTQSPLPDQVVSWLENEVRLGDSNDKRGIIVMTHHQPYSVWEGRFLAAAKQIDNMLPENRTLLWFFGHEHRLAFYRERRLVDKDWMSSFRAHMRLVGNGGMVDSLVRPKSVESLHAFDDRTYQSIPNDLGQADPVGFNGYVTLDFDGPEVTATYLSAACKADGAANCAAGLDDQRSEVLAQETIVVDEAGGLSQTWTNLSSGLSCVCDSTGELAPCGSCPQVERYRQWRDIADDTGDLAPRMHKSSSAETSPVFSDKMLV